MGDAVVKAIEVGYTHLDLAKVWRNVDTSDSSASLTWFASSKVYGNQEEIGKSLSGALGKSNIKREDLFIVSLFF